MAAESTATETKFSVARLNDTNYQPWKFKVKMLLIREGRWDIVNNPIPSPLPEGWKEKDEKAQTTISLSIEDSQIVHICNCKTARDMWLTLQKIHERANLSNKLYLLRKLYQTKLEYGQDMQNYIRNTLELVERLRGIGEEIRDFHVAALLLSGLPEDYEALVTALDARPDDELTLEYVRGKLTDEYKRKHNDKTEHKDETLLKTTSREKGNRREARRPQIRCKNCHKIGHVISDCWFLKNKTAKTNQNTSANKTTQHHRAKSATERDDETEEQETHTCFELITQESEACRWFIDSGATSHMTSDKTFFSKLDENIKDKIFLADGKSINAEGIGEGFMKWCTDDGEAKSILIKDVLYVPTLKGGLLSVKRLTEKGFTVNFQGKKCTISDINNKTVVVGTLRKQLFELIEASAANAIIHSAHNNCIHMWHRRLAHRDPRAIKRLEQENMAKGIKIQKCNELMDCTDCIKGKLQRKSFPSRNESQSKEPLDLIHSDVCGPMRTQTVSGYRYLITFIDDYSKYTMVYLMKSKAEAPEKLKEYLASVTNKFRMNPKILRADNGTEYTGNEFQKILKKYGIKFQSSVPYTPEQNGVAERKNRTLTEAAKTMLIDANLPDQYWGEAVMTACYLQNRLPSQSTAATPYELWNGKIPNIEHVRVFGSKAYFQVPKQKRSKWDPRAREGILIGYSLQSKGYRILIPETNQVVVTHTVRFDENQGFDETFKKANVQTTEQKNNEKLEVEINIPENKNDDLGTTPEISKIRRSERANKGVPPERLGYIAERHVTEEPQSLEDVLKLPSPEKDKWLEAINEEMNAMKENETWELVKAPPGRNIIKSKWVFQTKTDSSGNVCKYKARLVAKGFSQKFGEDYNETFAPVAKHTTLRVLLSIAASKQMQVKHFDVKTAFLNENLTEELYMQQPEGYEEPGKEDHVWKLNKAIYGLKQSAHLWYNKINDVLLTFGFTRSESDSCLYVKRREENCTYVLIYVDDILIASTSEREIENLYRKLNEHFELKDLGIASYYLGIHIERDETGNFNIHQKSKIEALTREFGMQDAKGSSIPMDPGYPKSQHLDERYLPTNEQYRALVGALLHIANTTRPDIMVAVNLLCRKVSKPTQFDWTAAKTILRYLKQTIDVKLNLGFQGEPDLKGFVDADWAGDLYDRKSTSGFLFKLGENSVSWRSQKQSTVALSSTEAEYTSMASACQELVWLRKLLEDFGYKVSNPTTIFEDNQGCIKIAASGNIGARVKHIDIKHHYIKDLQEKQIMTIEYCGTKYMEADLLTKPVVKSRLTELRPKIGLK